MPTDVSTVLAGLSPEKRKKTATSAAKVIAEEMTLQQFRRAHNRTQV